MHSSWLPKSLWGEALRHATWLKNQTATHALDSKMPFEVLYGRPPDLLALQMWGTTVWVHHADGSKLDVCMQTAHWLRLDVDTKAHCIFWPSAGNVTVERNVYFRMSALLKGEQNIPIAGSKQAATPSIPSSPSSPDQPNVPHSITAQTPVHVNQPEQHTVPPTQPRHSTCTCFPLYIICEQQAVQATHPLHKVPPLTPSDSGMLELTPAEEHDDDDMEESGGVWAIVDGAPMLHEAFEGLKYMLAAKTTDAEALEPHMLTKAKPRPDWPLWEKAIKEELATLKVARTWRLEEAPLGANIIGSKWVFKAKKDAAGNIVHYKARLVAQGFSQISSVDYDDTYTLVTCLALLHAITTMANWLGLELHQVDIKGAYLNGILHEDEVLYMQHPPGYKAQGIGCLVLCLLKTLYGLKQSGCHWYQKLSSIFLSLGFKHCSVNQAIFYKVDQDWKTLMVVAVHVDDCTIAASSKNLIKELITGLHKSLEVMDLSKLHWMLGVKIQCDCASHTIHLSQHAYIDSILHCYNLSDLKPLSMPMDTSI